MPLHGSFQYHPALLVVLLIYDCEGNTRLTCTLGDNTVIIGMSYR